MKIGQRLSYRNPLLHRLLQVTRGGDHVQHYEGVQKDANTVGQPAGEETQDEDDRGLQGFFLQHLALGALWQLCNDDAIAGEDDQPGQDEAHQDVLETENDCPRETGFLRVDALADGPGVGAVQVLICEEEVWRPRALHPGKDQVGYGQHSCRQPHTQIDHSGRKQLPRGLAVGSPHNCQVSVKTDEGQDQHAAVQVDSIDHVHGHTEETSKVPAAGCIHGPEGQREDEQEVSHGEVEPVLVRHRFDLFLATHDNNN